MNRQTSFYRFHRPLIFASWIVFIVALLRSGNVRPGQERHHGPRG